MATKASGSRLFPIRDWFGNVSSEISGVVVAFRECIPSSILFHPCLRQAGSGALPFGAREAEEARRRAEGRIAAAVAAALSSEMLQEQKFLLLCMPCIYCQLLPE